MNDLTPFSVRKHHIGGRPQIRQTVLHSHFEHVQADVESLLAAGLDPGQIEILRLKEIVLIVRTNWHHRLRAALVFPAVRTEIGGVLAEIQTLRCIASVVQIDRDERVPERLHQLHIIELIVRKELADLAHRVAWHRLKEAGRIWIVGHGN